MNKQKGNRREYVCSKGTIVSILTLLSIWVLVNRLGIVNSYVLPSPEKVINSFWEMIKSKALMTDVFISFGRVVKGFLIAFFFAFVLGVLRVVLPYRGIWFEDFIQFFRNVPPLSLIPLLILWCGIGETTKTVIIVLASFFPMYLNIVKGFSGCDRRLLEVGDVFGYSSFEKVKYIIFPYALADIFVGLRIGMGYSWRAIIGAEMVAASSGLGHMILFAQQMSRTDKVIIGIIVIGTVGVLTDWIFGIGIKKIFKGMGDNGWN